MQVAAFRRTEVRIERLSHKAHWKRAASLFISAVFFVEPALAKNLIRETVQVIENIPVNSSYEWNVDGHATTTCYSSGCSSYFRPARSGTANVQGAILKLLLPDGRIVVARCLAKTDLLTYMGAMTGGPVLCRDCRIPEPGLTLQADFYRSTVKLFMQAPSIDDSGKKFTETYYIKGILKPASSTKPASSSSVRSYVPVPAAPVPASPNASTEMRSDFQPAVATTNHDVSRNQSTPGAKQITPSRLAFEINREIQDRTDFGLELQANMAESKSMEFPADAVNSPEQNEQNASNCLIVTQPDGAAIALDGTKIGQSPLFFRLESRGSTGRVITVTKDGYITVTKSYHPDGKDLRIDVELVRRDQGFKVWPPDAQR